MKTQTRHLVTLLNIKSTDTPTVIQETKNVQTRFNDIFSGSLLIMLVMALNCICMLVIIGALAVPSIDHFTIACLLAWLLHVTEAEVDLSFLMLIMQFSCKLVALYIRKAVRFPAKQLQPRLHSKARQQSKTVKWSIQQM